MSNNINETQPEIKNCPKNKECSCNILIFAGEVPGIRLLSIAMCTAYSHS